MDYYTEFLKLSLSQLIRYGNRINIAFGQGHTKVPIDDMRALKSRCDELSDLITSIIAQQCFIQEVSSPVVAGTYVNTEYGIVPVESIKPGTAIEAMFGAQSDGSVYLPVKSIQEREFRVTIGDRKRKFKTLAQARKWITRALCGRK